MSLPISTLRPGLLVSLKTTVAGNVKYYKTEIEAAHILENGQTQRAAWKTVRTVEDAAEHDRAKVARGKAGSLIRGVCANSAFGLLCPENRASDLENAIRAARRIADDFNETANLSRLSVYVITGRVAPDDVEALRAINSEVRELMTSMSDGIKNLDVDAVREAANKARSLSQMLQPNASERVQEAIAVARSAARKIQKAGTTAAVEIDQTILTTIASARTAFLDLDGDDSVAAPDQEGRAVDLEPEKILAPEDYLTEGGNAVWPMPDGIEAAGPPKPLSAEIELTPDVATRDFYRSQLPELDME